MHKLNDLLNSGKINAIEYYNFFKNRSSNHQKNDNNETVINASTTTTTTNTVTTTTNTTSNNNGAISNQRQQIQRRKSSNPNRISKFNPYLMKTTNLQTFINKYASMPPPPPSSSSSSSSIVPLPPQPSPLPPQTTAPAAVINQNSLIQPPLFDRKKEDAINRIIRNERIKQIRIKIYEYELLKEYQKFDDCLLNNFNETTNNLLNSINDDYAQQHGTNNLNSQNGNFFLNEDADTISIESNGTDYGFESDDFNDTDETSIPTPPPPPPPSSSQSQPSNLMSTSQIYQRKNLQNTTSLKKSMSYCDYLCLNENKPVYQLGNSMDDLRKSHTNNDTSKNSNTDTSNSNDLSKNDELNVNNVKQQQRRAKNIKPGYELYQIGNLNTPQSTFQLKVSIINAELKNIVNVAKQAEQELSALQRRIQLLEEDLDRAERRLTEATAKLEEASKAADESERQRKSLEARSLADDERMTTLEKQLAEAQLIAEDADRRYDEVARRIAIMEVDLERTEDRAEAAEAKILELEEELKVVGNNMKSLEVSEQEAMQREESYEEQIRDVTSRLKDAEQRADLAERTMAKLQKEVDRLEDELLAEKEKYKTISEELDQTLNELSGY